MTSDEQRDEPRNIHLRHDALSALATVAVAALLIALGLVDLLNGVPTPAWAATLVSPWWHLVPVLVGGMAMLGERRWPVLAFGVGTIAFAVDVALGGSLAMTIVWWDLLYAVGLYAGRRWRLAITGTLITVTAALSVVAAEYNRDLAQFLLTALQVGSIALVPLWWAASVRQARELAAVAGERARLEVERARLEVERANGLVRIAELDRADAVRAERTAMARDLHDVISSHLSAIAIHSGVALAAPADGERDRSALAQVRAASLASLDEMRLMINLLRSDTAEPFTTHEGMAALPALLRWAESSGLVINAEYPDRIEPNLPTAVDQAAMRVMREALTNSLKHGAGDAQLNVRVHGDALTIEVRNRYKAPTTSSGGGTGLVSMRERVVALDGDFLAGDTGARDTGAGDAGADDRGAGDTASGDLGAQWLVKASFPLKAGVMQTWTQQEEAAGLDTQELGVHQLGAQQSGTQRLRAQELGAQK
ncbi:MAG: hypothetical protein JWQ43_4164 [Glaciihabitans sp.]|nr:hypothetical protein [Glaciihabitans sp.]